MALVRHTLTLRTQHQDGTPLEGAWTLFPLTTGKRLLDTEGNVLVAGDWDEPTVDGVAIFNALALPQDGIDPPDAQWRLVFEPEDKGRPVVSKPFGLTTDLTVEDVLDLPTGTPITVSILSEAVAARDAARDAQTGAEAAETGALAAQLGAENAETAAEDARDAASESAVAAAESAATAALAMTVGIDTDGTPYFDPGNIPIGSAATVQADTDGVPYFAIGA